LNTEHEERLYKSEIICDRAHRLFGLILRLLCQRANVTQDFLEEEGKAYRDYLLLKGYIRPGYALGSLEQDAISRVLSGDRWPSYDQVHIWLHVIEETLNSEKYKKVRREHGLTIYELEDDLKTDLYHLAGFGSPDEIIAAFEKRIRMLTDPFPDVRSGSKSPRRQGRYTTKGTNNHHSVKEPVNEI
jgi:hypothetical protein